jgi:hypothetical protein
MLCKLTDSQGDPVLIYTEKILLVKTFTIDPEDPEQTESFKVVPQSALYFVTGGMILVCETTEEYHNMEKLGLDGTE